MLLCFKLLRHKVECFNLGNKNEEACFSAVNNCKTVKSIRQYTTLSAIAIGTKRAKLDIGHSEKVKK